MSPEIYLDTNATTPVLPQALAAACRTMQEAVRQPQQFPQHRPGRAGPARVGAPQGGRACSVPARADCCSSAAPPKAYRPRCCPALCALRERRAAGDTRARLLVYGATEHKAVPESLAYWNRVLGLDLEIRALPVDTQGLHDLTDCWRNGPARSACCAPWRPTTRPASCPTLPASNSVLARTGSADPVAGRLRAGPGQAATEPAGDAHRLRPVFRPQAVCTQGHWHAVRARRQSVPPADGRWWPGRRRTLGHREHAGHRRAGRRARRPGTRRHLLQHGESCTAIATSWCRPSATHSRTWCSTRRWRRPCPPR